MFNLVVKNSVRVHNYVSIEKYFRLSFYYLESSIYLLRYHFVKMLIKKYDLDNRVEINGQWNSRIVRGSRTSRGTLLTQTGRIFGQPTDILASSFACRLSRGTMEALEAGTRTKLRVHSNKATRPLALWIMFSVLVEPTSELPRACNDEIRPLEASVNTSWIVDTCREYNEWFEIKFMILILRLYIFGSGIEMSMSEYMFARRIEQLQ